uniref:Uncharacterized protein n=1 Tax=viral metagenome TaxID=1070528 RepID=A0A6C0LZL5_9ZZZZ
MYEKRGLNMKSLNNDSSDGSTKKRSGNNRWNNSRWNNSRWNNADHTMLTTKYAPYAQGIRANQILPGQEDLYILKSEVIPPVCPVCPANKGGGGSSGGSKDAEKCPPCPPCARCPEPAFECKKVPNYNRVNDDSMPYPVLTSFNQFGL